jgi:DNA polymerase III sliding clamp (beta) subunit (PCNA family)
MKINKTALVAALRHAGTVRPDKVNIIPGADGITINAAEKGHGGVVTQSVVEAEIDAADAAFQAPYQRFRALVESMPDGVLSISVTASDAVTVRNGVTRLKTRAIFDPALDLLSTEGSQTCCTLPGRALRSAIGQTVHAIAEKDLRAFMTTLHLEVNNGIAEAVGTDGLRMMISRFDAQDAGSDISVSIINAALPLLSAMAEAGDVAIHLVGKTVVLARDAWLCRVPITDKYPDWRRMLSSPVSTDPGFTVDASALLPSMRRMIIVAEGEAGQARYGHGVTLSSDGDALRIQLAGNDSEDRVAIEAVTGNIDIGANARQVLDLLDVVASVGKIRITHIGSGGSHGRIMVVPDDQRDPSASRFASIITEFQV